MNLPFIKRRGRNLKPTFFRGLETLALKEETMEDQTVIQEMSPDNSNTEVSSAMRMIQQKRKLQKKQEREKRAANRKQEIAALSKAKAKDYQKKAGERQKTIAKDINKMSSKKTETNSFDWQGAFSTLNEEFSTLSIENRQELTVWLELSEENQ